jgi:hypothetical protein
MRVNVSRLGVHGLLVGVGGSGEIAAGLQKNAGVVVGSGETRPRQDRLPVSLERQVEFAEHGADDAQIEPCLCGCGVEVDGLLVAVEGFGLIAGLMPHIPPLDPVLWTRGSVSAQQNGRTMRRHVKRSGHE